MKKLLLLTNVLSIAIIIWLLYNKENKPKAPPVADVKKELCTNCDTETVGQTFEHFRDVVNNYRVKHWDAMNETPDFNVTTKNVTTSGLASIYSKTDARSIWFSLDTIKKFLCTIEKYNNKLKVPNQKLGIRFYYAVYENDYAVVEKRNRHTLFMVPTYQANASSPQVDFDPRATYNEQVRTKKKFTEMINYVMIASQGSPFYDVKKPLLMLGKYTTDPTPETIQNTGEICPANCPTPNTFTVIDP